MMLNPIGLINIGRLSVRNYYLLGRYPELSYSAYKLHEMKVDDV